MLWPASATAACLQAATCDFEHPPNGKHAFFFPERTLNNEIKGTTTTKPRNMPKNKRLKKASMHYRFWFSGASRLLDSSNSPRQCPQSFQLGWSCFCKVGCQISTLQNLTQHIIVAIINTKKSFWRAFTQLTYASNHSWTFSQWFWHQNLSMVCNKVIIQPFHQGS